MSINMLCIVIWAKKNAVTELRRVGQKMVGKRFNVLSIECIVKYLVKKINLLLLTIAYDKGLNFGYGRLPCLNLLF